MKTSPVAQDPAPLKDLAVQLRRAATRLSTAAGGGSTVAAAARRVRRSVAALETALDDHEQGVASGVTALQTLLNSPASKKALGPVELRRIARDSGLGRIVAETPGAVRKEFLRLAAERDAVQPATASVRMALAESRSASGPTVEAATLRREFLRLGGLDDEALAAEARTAYRRVATVRALANANAIRRADTADRESLWKEIVHHARRLHGNLRHLPAG